MKKSSVAWLFAVIILSILLVLSVVLGMTGYYFSVSYISSHADLKVGENVVVNVQPNQSSVVSFTFDGAYLPNENIPQVIKINAQNLSQDIKVRVKAEIFGLDDEANFQFVTTEHFEQKLDGYYYFDEVVKAGSKITFCTYLIVPQDADFKSNEKYILSVVVETLDSSLDDSKIWKNSL